MIRPGTVWGISRAESRLTRRLVRYWLFVIIGALVAAGQFTQFMFVYKVFSFGSGSAATINPRYFLSSAASVFVFVFYIGLIFLAFEIRARDQRERIFEVLDSRPVSNSELLIGRALGIMLPVWVALAVVVGLLSLVAWLFHVPIHARSVVTMLFFYTIPAFTFTLGLIFLMTLLVRHRLIAAIASLLVLAGGVIGSFFLPFWTAPLVDTIGGNVVLFPSDLVPKVINAAGLIQRTGYLLMGLGMLGFAIAVHPRRDGGSRTRRTAVATALFVIGIGLCTWLALDTRSNVARQAAWGDVHRARLGAEVPDLLAIRGDVNIDPGRLLELDLELTLQGTDAAPTHALLSFNPGLHVSTVDSGGRALEFTHADGLLEIELPTALGPQQNVVLTLQAAGEVDPWFSYIDAAKNPYLAKMKDASIVFLGYDPLVWDRRFVALMPGVRWLPASGPEFDRGESNNPLDFFAVDLTVELPKGWLAAGPGRREDVGGDAKHERFRYVSGAPLPEVCLIASRFESVTTEIAGVTLEALLHPSHKQSLSFFAEAGEEITNTLTEKFEDATAAGLDYPYSALTLVEVPIPLRGYGGGWRMDTTLTQPAMILTRENTFPTAWWEGFERFRKNSEDQEGGVPRVKRQVLEAFFENDFNGGNPFTAAARSFFGFQTRGIGPEALPMDYVLEQLTSQTVTGKRGFFSVHFFKGDFGTDFMMAGQATGDKNSISDSYAEVLIDRITSTNKVWDAISQVKLTEIDPRNDPEETINVLALKGGAMADSMLDGMSRVTAGEFLASLREHRSGSQYSRADLLAAGDEVGEDLSTWLDVWIDQTELPGFWAEETRLYRLKDDATGAPRYQLLVRLRNGEAPAGLVRLEYRTESDGSKSKREKSAPVMIPGNGAVEIGMVLSEPVSWLRVSPYLALNRTPFNLTVPALDQERIIEDDPFQGQRVVQGDTDSTGALIVDDLDAGFSVEVTGNEKGLRATGTKDDTDLDGGLPTLGQRVGSKWSRMLHPDTWGKYRHTAAIVRKGKGVKRAVFATEIPASGSWELSYYVPAKQGSGVMSSRTDRGSWKLVVDDGTGTHEIEFDAESADSGWNSLGKFEIAKGTVRLIVSDETQGGYVLADAIRWTPEKRSGAEVVDAQ